MTSQISYLSLVLLQVRLIVLAGEHVVALSDPVPGHLQVGAVQVVLREVLPDPDGLGQVLEHVTLHTVCSVL